LNTYNSYKFEGAAGVAPFLAMVAGAVAGGCNLPGGANAKGFVGFTVDSLLAAQQGQAVPVVRGRVRATAAAAITHGHWVNIADNTGKVQDCQAAVDAAPGAPAEVNVIGKAETDTTNSGDQLFVTTQEFVVQIAAS
jgi:hypothetical protein